jgi:hypothetical protein
MNNFFVLFSFDLIRGEQSSRFLSRFETAGIISGKSLDIGRSELPDAPLSLPKCGDPSCEIAARTVDFSLLTPVASSSGLGTKKLWYARKNNWKVSHTKKL